MTKSLVPALSLVGMVAPSVAGDRPTVTTAVDELARLDAAQKNMVAKADVEKLATLSDTELTINAPTGRVLTPDQFLAMMRDGRIGAENFERTVERVGVSGDIGVVMGREILTPTADSELGRTYGAVPLNRCYTNVYRRDHGRWLCFARHANVVPGAVGAR